MEIRKLFLDDPLSKNSEASMSMVRANLKKTLVHYYNQDLLSSLQQFILAVVHGQEEIVVDGIDEPVPIPAEAMKSIGALANYAMVTLWIEVAKEQKAKMN